MQDYFNKCKFFETLFHSYATFCLVNYEILIAIFSAILQMIANSLVAKEYNCISTTSFYLKH